MQKMIWVSVKRISIGSSAESEKYEKSKLQLGQEWHKWTSTIGVEYPWAWPRLKAINSSKFYFFHSHSLK